MDWPAAGHIVAADLPINAVVFVVDAHRAALGRSTGTNVGINRKSLRFRGMPGDLLLQFLALLVGALIERQIRTAMQAARTADIPLYPELRACEAPSTERILAVFADVTRHELNHDGRLVQTFEAELIPLQQQILDLLGVPLTAYTAN
jgi:hypothetical protein